MTRAKFECISIKQTSWSKEYEFSAVIAGAENEAFFKTTPSGKISVSIKNDAVVFEVGKQYFVDFSPTK